MSAHLFVSARSRVTAVGHLYEWRLLAKLYGGGYYAYVVKPGEYAFSLGARGPVRVEFGARPGKTYFLKLYMLDVPNPFKRTVRPVLTSVPDEIGDKEIRECRMVSEYGFGL